MGLSWTRTAIRIVVEHDVRRRPRPVAREVQLLGWKVERAVGVARFLRRQVLPAARESALRRGFEAALDPLRAVGTRSRSARTRIERVRASRNELHRRLLAFLSENGWERNAPHRVRP